MKKIYFLLILSFNLHKLMPKTENITLIGIARQLFNPSSEGSSPYSTKSLNEKEIDKIFVKFLKLDKRAFIEKEDPNQLVKIGSITSKSIPIGKELIQYIKNFYFYLEYVIRVETASKLLALANKKGIKTDSYLKFITDKKEKNQLTEFDWKEFVKAVKPSSWQALNSECPSNWREYSKDLIIHSSSWEELPKTDFWKSINLNAEDLVASSFWQLCIKTFIAKYFNENEIFAKNIHATELSMFSYIYNYEVAYYQSDFTHMRNNAEFLRVNALIRNNLIKKLLKESTDWGKNKLTNGEFDQLKVLKEIEQFTDQKSKNFENIFYQNTNKLIDFASGKIDFSKKWTDTIKNIQKNLIKDLKGDKGKFDLLNIEIICLSMYTLLQGLFHNLYNDQIKIEGKTVLDWTIQAINKSNLQPSFFLYDKNNYFLIQDLQNIMQNIKKLSHVKLSKHPQKPIKLNPPKVQVQGFFHNAWNSISEGVTNASNQISASGREIGSGVQKTLKSGYSGSKAIGELIASQMLQVPGLDDVTVNLIDKATGKPLNKKTLAKNLQNAFAKNFNLSEKELEGAFDDYAKSGKNFVESYGDVVAGIIGALDKRLGEDYKQYYDNLGDFVYDVIKDIADCEIETTYNTVKLNIDIIEIIQNLITAPLLFIADPQGFWSEEGKTLATLGKQFVNDLVFTVLDSITLTIKLLKDSMGDIIKICGTLIGIVTDEFIDGISAIAVLFSWIPGVSYQSVHNTLSKHRHLIEQSLTLAFMVVACLPMGFGMAVPLIAMTLGMGVFSLIQGAQEDTREAEQAEETAERLKNFTQYIADSWVIAENKNGLLAHELENRLQMQITNQERNLGFYQNFLSNNLLNIKNHMSQALGNYYSLILTPNKYGMLPNDVGSIYGFKTNWLELSPSLGFADYNAGRKTIGQEIAQESKVLSEKNGNLEKAFWFNQKMVRVFEKPQNNLNIHIRFRAIELKEAYYIGLYLGNMALYKNKPDLEYFNAQKNKKTIFNADVVNSKLAKMFVIKKEGELKDQSLGIYEHDSPKSASGWLKSDIKKTDFNFTIGKWYHMKAQLNSNMFNVKIWEDGKKEPNEWDASQEVEKTNQQVIGVISSGAAIEFATIDPKMDFKINKKIRADYEGESEQTRSQIARKKLNRLLNPDFGSLKLKSINKYHILRGNYIYETKDTKLKDKKGNALTDYVITCKLSDNVIVPGSIGYQPTIVDPLNYVASLITNNIYDKNGKVVTNYGGIWGIYKSTHKPTEELTNKINKLVNEILKGPFTFGNMTLNATGIEDINNNIFIYTTQTPTPELKGEKDYVVMVSDDLMNIGMQFSNSINKIASMISGDIFNKNGKKVGGGYDILSMYQNKLRPELLKSIKATRKIFNENLSKEEAEKRAQEKKREAKLKKQASSKDISNPEETKKASGKQQTDSSGDNPAEQSLQKRKEDADDNNFGGWGF